ncbi:hypothetical protein Vi05172_g8313 [Venturia inaequalis]|nr:hypothetical protein Vi05172_g8313 [Venturia inaequalis]
MKTSPTLALINNSWFRRQRKLQIEQLLADGWVIDSRGALPLSYGSEKTSIGEKTIKGYKVRKWKLWVKTGKQLSS